MTHIIWPDDGLPATIGPHEVLAVLSIGSETDVLLAQTRGPHGFSRPVVLKRLRPERAFDPANLRALAREAMAYARLGHPAIVRLYDFFEHEGQHVLVLEYVNGMTLRELVAHLRLRGEVLGDDVSLYVMAQVFSALAAAHAAREPATGEFASVIHRDVSPKNVLVDWEGAVKLTDFGIAKLAGVSGDTRAGLLKGTYGYMAPEQVLGDPTTVRTDVYAGCLLLRELLLGKRAFERGDMPELEFLQAMADPRLEPIEELRPGIPPRVARVLRVGLEPNPDRRDIACAEIRDVLLAEVNAERARAELVVLLHEVRPTQNQPLLEKGEATEPNSGEGPAAMPREPEPAAAPPRARVGSMRPTVPDVQEALPDPPAIAPATPPAIQVPTAPSAFRVSQMSMTPGAWRTSLRPRWRVPATLAGVAAALLVVLVALLVSRPRPPALAGVRSALAAAVIRPANAAVAAPAHPALPSRSAAPVAAPAVSPGSAASGATPATGTIVTATRAHDHRIYVDGHVAGETGRAIEVRCGKHEARYGSQGRAQAVDVPCGGQVTLSPRW